MLFLFQISVHLQLHPFFSQIKTDKKGIHYFGTTDILHYQGSFESLKVGDSGAAPSSIHAYKRRVVLRFSVTVTFLFFGLAMMENFESRPSF